MGAEIICSLTDTGSFLLAPMTFPRIFCHGAVNQFTKFKVTSPKICNLVGHNCSVLANIYGRTTEVQKDYRRTTEGEGLCTRV